MSISVAFGVSEIVSPSRVSTRLLRIEIDMVPNS